MDEVRFVLKCFAFSALLLVFSQIKMDRTTIEEYVQSSLVNSHTSEFVNKAAEGGVKLIHDGWKWTKESYTHWRKQDSFASDDKDVTESLSTPKETVHAKKDVYLSDENEEQEASEE